MNQFKRNIFVVVFILLTFAFFLTTNTNLRTSPTVESLLGAYPTPKRNYSRVIRIIHQSWKNNNIPDIFHRYVPSWRKCFPNYEYRLWTDEDNRNLIKTHYPWFLLKYDSFPLPIFRADCARYFYMFHYGGIYTDLDNECLVPFEHLLENYTLVFGNIDNVNRKSPLKDKYVQNSFMYSQPNESFWMELLLDIFHSSSSETADIVTGPVVLTDRIYQYLIATNGSNRLKVYDARYFNPLSWGSQHKNPKMCKPFNIMSEDEYQKCREYYLRQGSYVVQYHTHVW